MEKTNKKNTYTSTQLHEKIKSTKMSIMDKKNIAVKKEKQHIDKEMVLLQEEIEKVTEKISQFTSNCQSNIKTVIGQVDKTIKVC